MSRKVAPFLWLAASNRFMAKLTVTLFTITVSKRVASCSSRQTSSRGPSENTSNSCQVKQLVSHLPHMATIGKRHTCPPLRVSVVDSMGELRFIITIREHVHASPGEVWELMRHCFVLFTFVGKALAHHDGCPGVLAGIVAAVADYSKGESSAFVCVLEGVRSLPPPPPPPPHALPTHQNTRPHPPPPDNTKIPKTVLLLRRRRLLLLVYCYYEYFHHHKYYDYYD